MINVNVFSEEKAWTKRIRNKKLYMTNSMRVDIFNNISKLEESFSIFKNNVRIIYPKLCSFWSQKNITWF